MARVKTISDDAVLDAALVIMNLSGPAAITFASVAIACGLSPATLVQRFRGKDALIEAALVRAWDLLDAKIEQGDATAALSPQGAVDLLVSLSDYGDHDQYAEGLLLLREDIRNPVLRARGEAWGAAMALALGRRLSADPNRQLTLGRLMASQWQGALLWWGFSRDGLVTDYIAGELTAWLAVLS